MNCKTYWHILIPLSQRDSSRMKIWDWRLFGFDISPNFSSDELFSGKYSGLVFLNTCRFLISISPLKILVDLITVHFTVAGRCQQEMFFRLLIKPQAPFKYQSGDGFYKGNWTIILVAVDSLHCVVTVPGRSRVKFISLPAKWHKTLSALVLGQVFFFKFSICMVVYLSH